MASMRAKAADTYSDKLNRMGLGGGGRGTKIRTAEMGEDEGVGHALPDDDGTQGVASGKYATDYADESENEEMVAKKRGKPRLDRAAYKRGGRVGGKHKGVNVNVIVAPQNAPKVAPMMPPGGAPPPPMPMPPPGAGGPPPMPGGPMGGLPGGGAMPRKKGGRVPMTAGAGGGEGRLQKIKEYGSNARK